MYSMEMYSMEMYSKVSRTKIGESPTFARNLFIGTPEEPAGPRNPFIVTPGIFYRDTAGPEPLRFLKMCSTRHDLS